MNGIGLTMMDERAGGGAVMGEAEAAISRTVAANLRYERTRRGWTQARLAAAMGVGRASVVAMENVKQSITIYHLVAAADALGIATTELLSPRFRVAASARAERVEDV